MGEKLDSIGNRSGMYIFVAAAGTFTFMCAVELVLLVNGLREATCAVAKASVFLFIPLSYTAFKCLPSCTARALRIAAVFSLCLCATCAIAVGYMANNTLVAKPTIALAVALAVPLVSIYVARFFPLFGTQAAPPPEDHTWAQAHSQKHLSFPCLKWLEAAFKLGTRESHQRLSRSVACYVRAVAALPPCLLAVRMGFRYAHPNSMGPR